MRLILLALILTKLCAGQTNVTFGIRYDKKSNLTTVTLIPYGDVNIPGKWKKQSYNSVSGQYFLENKDSAIIAVARNPKNAYSFYRKKMSDKEFVSSFYKWDSTYHSENGRKAKILEDSSAVGFIAWQLTEKNQSSIFLYTVDKGICVNLMAAENKMTEKQRIDFLKSLLRAK